MSLLPPVNASRCSGGARAVGEVPDLPVLPALVQVVADGVQLVLTSQRRGTTHNEVPQLRRGASHLRDADRRL
jgi:hypothetical protein